MTEEDFKQPQAAHHNHQHNEQLIRKETSDKINLYLLFFDGVDPICIQDSQSKNNIPITDNHQHKSQSFFSIQIIKRTTSSQVFTFRVKFGQYSLDLTIFNHRGNSPSHNFKSINTKIGVYPFSSISPRSIVKCVPIVQEEFDLCLLKTIRQYTIFKIASSLKIGPALSSLHSFDIIVYDTCIEFAMQECLVTEALSHQYFSDSHERSLKAKLRLFHKLQMVHMDIKPSNISFSRTLGQLVFIDFGFSTVLEQRVGQKTLTPFYGSLNYCCPQMLECYTQEKALMVDLYYNDVFCFRQAFNQLRLKPSSQEEDILSEDSSDFQEFIENIRNSSLNSIKSFYRQLNIKQQLYNQRIIDFNSRETAQFIMNRSVQLIQFASTLPFSISVQKLYKFIKQNKKDFDEFSRVQLNSNISRYHILSLGYAKDKNEQSLLKRNPLFQSFIGGLEMNSFQSITFQKLTKNDIAIQQIVLNMENSAMTDKKIYFKKMVEFLDLRSASSTFPNKIKAATIMNKLYLFLQKDSTEIQLLIACNASLFNNLIYHQTSILVKYIPIIFGNLVILGAQKEVLFSYRKMIQNKSIQCGVMLYLAVNYFYVSNFYDYKISKSTGKIRLNAQQIKCYNDQLPKLVERQKPKYDRYYYYMQLVFGENSSKHSDQQMILIIDLIRQQKQLSNEFKRVILLSLYTSLITRYLYEQRLDVILDYIKNINQLQQLSKNKFQNYHHIMCQIFNSTNNFQGQTAIIHRMQQCIGSQDLLYQFQIYGMYQLRCFQLGLRSMEEFVHTMYAIMKKINLKQISNLLIPFQFSIIASKNHEIKHVYMQTIKSDNKILKFISSEEKDLKIILRQITLMCQEMFPNTINQIIEKINYMEQMNFQLVFYLLKWSSMYYQIYSCRLPQNYFQTISQSIDFLQQKSFQQNTALDIKFLKASIKVKKYRTQLNFTAMTETITDYLHHQPQSIHHNQVLIFLGYAIQLAQQLPAYSNKKNQSIENLYKWITHKNMWRDIFTNKSNFLRTTYCIDRYLIMANRLEQFWNVHKSITACLQQYQTKQFIILYRHSTINSMFSPKLAKKVGFFLAYQKFKEREISNDFLVLMLACLLINFSLSKMHYVILFNRISRLNYYAKRGLEKIVFYAISMTEKIEEKILHKRHRDFMKRKYIKNSLLVISKIQLEKYFIRKIKIMQIRKPMALKMEKLRITSIKNDENYFEQRFYPLKNKSPFT